MKHLLQKILSSLSPSLAAVAMTGLTLTVSPSSAAPIAISSYTYDAAGVQPGGQPSLFDAGNLKLTDGVYPISGWSDGTNVGFIGGSAGQLKPGVTFDLGGLFDLTTIDVWTEEQFAYGSESVTISSSVNGSTWSATTVADTLAWVDQGAVFGNKVTIDVSSLPTGQFYKMDFIEPGQWMMITEVDFEGSAVPEPTTTALLGLGGLALIMRRRK